MLRDLPCLSSSHESHTLWPDLLHVLQCLFWDNVAQDLLTLRNIMAPASAPQPASSKPDPKRRGHQHPSKSNAALLENSRPSPIQNASLARYAALIPNAASDERLNLGNFHTCFCSAAICWAVLQDNLHFIQNSKNWFGSRSKSRSNLAAAFGPGAFECEQLPAGYLVMIQGLQTARLLTTIQVAAAAICGQIGCSRPVISLC